jgi:hypothetical protein
LTIANSWEKYNPYLSLVLIFALFSRGFPSISFVYFLIYPILVWLVLLYFIVLFRTNKTNNFFEVLPKWVNKFQKKNFEKLGLKDGIVLSFIMFGLWALITSFWSSDQITTMYRSLFFILLLIGSFIAGRYLTKFKIHQIGYFFLFINLLIVSSNLLSFIIGIPDLPIKGAKYFGFMGFTNHPNKLGQYIFLTFPFALFSIYYLRELFKEKRGYLIVLAVLLILSNFYVLWLSKSRASMGALIMFIFVFVIFSINLKKIFTIVVPTIVSLALIIGLSSNLTKYINNFIFKNDSSNIFSSREYLINASYKSALDGGIFGLGYGISSEKYVAKEFGDFRTTEYFQREKTVSLFAIIEETGIVGMFLFLSGVIAVLVHNFKLLQAHKNSNYFHFYLFTFSFLLALNVYAQIESWWIGIGSVPLPLFFILSGIISKTNNNHV